LDPKLESESFAQELAELDISKCHKKDLQKGDQFSKPFKRTGTEP
jgi:hypothetical protein